MGKDKSWVERLEGTKRAVNDDPDKQVGKVLGELESASTGTSSPTGKIEKILEKGTENQDRSFAERTGKTPNQDPIKKIIEQRQQKPDFTSNDPDLNENFDKEAYEKVNTKQEKIDGRFEKKTSTSATRSSIKKGFTFKPIKAAGWVGAILTIHEVGSQIYDAYQNYKKQDDPDIKIDKNEDKIDANTNKAPESLPTTPVNQGDDIENQLERPPSPTSQQNQGKEQTEPLSKNDESPLENPEVNEKAQIEVDHPEGRLASFFRGDKQEVEVDDLREISDGQKESLYLAFNENGKNLPEVENDSRDFELEQNETPEYANNDRTAAFFRGDDQEVEMYDLPEISDEQKNSLYLAFNESDAYAEKEDYFPIDKSTTLDFAVSDNKEVDMIADGPDMGDGGGGDGGGDGD